MFLTKEQFLEEIGANNNPFTRFTLTPDQPVRMPMDQLPDFLRSLTILYRTPQSAYAMLSEKIRTKPDDLRVRDATGWANFLIDFLILNRSQVLTNFYNSYLSCAEIGTLFQTPLFPEKLKRLEATFINREEHTIHIQRRDNTKRILRNLYAREMLRDTTITNSIAGKPNFWQSLADLFQGRFDDRLFAPSSIALYIRDENLQTPIYLLQQYQSKASIMNPAMIYTVLNTLLRPQRPEGGWRIFTPELSWSSYLLAFLESGGEWRDYVGVDVMGSVVRKSQWLHSEYKRHNPDSSKQVSILQCPSESLLRNEAWLTENRNSFDTILFCPPYFDLEIYPDSSGQQSIDLYRTYDEWLVGYLQATLELCRTVLRPGGRLACIMGGYHKKLKGDFYDLAGDFLHIMEGMPDIRLVDRFFLKNRMSPLKNNDKMRGEFLYIFERT